jgi:HD-GYP domain-containing protein (c-di-GMP phosphodiesterase class II)
MKSLPLSELREKLYFDAPVYLDEHYILLSPDVHTPQDLLQRLARWGYESVCCDGSPVEAPTHLAAGPTVANKSTLELDVKEKQQMEKARKLYYGLATFTVETFNRFAEANRLDLAAITERLKELIDLLKSSRDTILRLPEFVYISDNYLYQHCLNCAILSLAIGDSLRLPPHRLIELGIGALLHDIGMLKIPDALYLNPHQLGPKEWQMIKAHPMLSYRILKGFSVSDTIALTAYEHHERLDGTGYPRALAGEKITLYSRILAVADSYESMTTKRPFRANREGHAALLELLKGRGVFYDEAAVRALIYCLSVYPLGTTVLLSNGAMGRVIRINPQSPKTPIVQVLIDRDGNRLAGFAVIGSSEAGTGEAPAIRRNLSWKEVEAHNLY